MILRSSETMLNALMSHNWIFVAGTVSTMSARKANTAFHIKTPRMWWQRCLSLQMLLCIKSCMTVHHVTSLLCTTEFCRITSEFGELQLEHKAHAARQSESLHQNSWWTRSIKFWNVPKSRSCTSKLLLANKRHWAEVFLYRGIKPNSSTTLRETEKVPLLVFRLHVVTSKWM